MSDQASALVASLLEAQPAEREQLLRSADVPTLAEVVVELGHRRAVAAAEVLSLVESSVTDRALRKAARRELHRLRSIGIQPSEPALAAAAEPATRLAQLGVPVSQAWATDTDPAGSRAVWLLADRPLGGAWFSALVLNDLHGLAEMNLLDTTRKRVLKELDDARRGGGTWVGLPGEYALALVREAVDISREAGGGLPARYRAFREAFGEAPGPPARALVYEMISPVEATFHPDWLADSAELLTEPELAGWHVPVPVALRGRALDVARATQATLLVPGHTPEEQALQLLADAAEQALTPTMRRALRRRLEETGYIFVATDRLAAARLAVAAAHALDGPSGHPERHPLLRLLLAGGLARLIASETVTGQRASEALITLLERASQSSPEKSAVATRPSGLILPR